MTELADQGGNGLDTGIRDAVEASYASHSVSPDIGSAVSQAVEHRDREKREAGRGTDRFASEAKTSDSIREAARQAINETKQKAASGPTEAVQGAAIDPGAPKDWDAAARAEWASLPQAARLAIQRAETTRQQAYAPYAEIDNALAPYREVYRQHGIQSDAQAVKQLFDWESRFRNPQTRAQAFHELAQAYQTDLRDLVGSPASSPHVEIASRQVSEFATADRPHFERVRFKMGALMSENAGRYSNPDGTVSQSHLDRAYQDACRAEGLSVASASQPSPRSGQTERRGKGLSVRETILAQVKQLRSA
ncbi:MAG: hypothetical protein EKK33_08985 [Bradyrhizobiaceae bacterium]|nr:MAG: hypothetical protein EKK33_08985 [Bradyrhizobiaceae bacterium]